MNNLYHEFINEVITSSDFYKKDSSSKSFIMAINSEWGSGKTTFVNEFIDKYKDSDNYIIIKYDAWENDFWDNSFEPLIYNLLSDEHFKMIQLENNIKEKFISSVKSLALGIGKFYLGKIVGKESVNEISQCVQKISLTVKDLLVSELEPVFERYSEFKKNLKVFKQIMGELQKKLDKKIVIIIDELDRCKPDFAIKTLEFIKHIFDIENYVYIFSIDKEQLSESIKVIYGNGINAEGYLNRFFDYTSLLPVPNINDFINQKLKECGVGDVYKEQVITLLTSQNRTFRDLEYFFVALKVVLTHHSNLNENIFRNIISLTYLKTLESKTYSSIDKYLKYLDNNPQEFRTNFIEKYKKIFDYFADIFEHTLNRTSCVDFLLGENANRDFELDVKNNIIIILDEFSKKRFINVKIVMINCGFFTSSELYQSKIGYQELIVQFLMKKIEMINFIENC